MFPVPRVEEPVGPRAVVPVFAHPMDTKGHLDRRSQGTEGAAVIGREVDNPMAMGTPAFVVGFQQVVDLVCNPMRRSASHWLHCRRSQIDPGREVAGRRR